MAGRKDKNVVDYFPHYCTSTKTLCILENKYGHIGYSVWFKTLEILGSSENHYIDLRNEIDLYYLVSKMNIEEDTLVEIYNLLAKLGGIDKHLWSEKIIYSDNFIKNITDAYARRKNKCMQKSELYEFLGIKCTHKLNKCTHQYTEYSIEDKSIEEEKEKIYKKDFPENQEPELSEFKGTDTTVNTPEKLEDKTSALKDEIIGSGVYPKKELVEYYDYISNASTQLKDMWVKGLQAQRLTVALPVVQNAFFINLAAATEYKKYNQATIQRYFFNWMKKNAYQYKPRQDPSKPTFTSFNKSNAR